MSYIVKHLESLKDLQKELETNPEKIKHYSKYGAFVGPTASIDFILNKIAEHRFTQTPKSA
jgi:hypothetical protein